MSQNPSTIEKPTLLMKDKLNNSSYMGLTPTRVKGAPGRVPLHLTSSSNDMMISPARPSRAAPARVEAAFSSPLPILKKSRKTSLDQRPAWNNEFVVTASEKKVVTRQGLTPRKVPLNQRNGDNGQNAQSPSTPFPSKSGSKEVNQLRGKSSMASSTTKDKAIRTTKSFQKKLQESQDESSQDLSASEWREKYLASNKEIDRLQKQLHEAKTRITELESLLADSDNKENNASSNKEFKTKTLDMKPLVDSVETHLAEAFKESVKF